MSDEAGALEALLREEISERAAKIVPKADDVSSTPGLDPRPEPAGGRDFPADPSPSGPLVEVRGVPLDVTDSRTKELQGLDETERNLRGFAGGLAAGGIASGAAKIAPGLRALLNATSTAPRVAGGVIEGAASGAASTAGSTLAAEGRAPTGTELAVGAGIGGALGAARGAFGAAVKGAPQRDEKALLTAAKASGMTKADYGRFFTTREGAVRTLRADPELRASLGKPEQTLELLEQRFATASSRGADIMNAADAKNGRIPTVELRKAIGDVFNEFEAHGGAAKANPAAAAVYKMAEQFSTGIGKDVKNPPTTAEVRKFLTEEIGSKLNTNPSVADTQTDRAAAAVYGRLKDLIDKHVSSASPALGKELATLNEQQATYKMLQDAAQKRAAALSTSDAPKPGGIVDHVKSALPYLRAGTGATAGAFVGHQLGIDTSTAAAIGSAAGFMAPVAKKAVTLAAEGVTRQLAKPGGQAVGKALQAAGTAGAHLLVPKIVGAVTDEDRRAALAETAKAVYGP